MVPVGISMAPWVSFDSDIRLTPSCSKMVADTRETTVLMVASTHSQGTAVQFFVPIISTIKEAGNSSFNAEIRANALLVALSGFAAMVRIVAMLLDSFAAFSVQYFMSPLMIAAC